MASAKVLIKKTLIKDYKYIGENIVALSYCHGEDLWQCMFKDENLRYKMQKVVFSSAIKKHIQSPQNLSFTMHHGDDIIGHGAFSYYSTEKKYSKNTILDPDPRTKGSEQSKKSFSFLSMIKSVGIRGSINSTYIALRLWSVGRDINQIINDTFPKRWDLHQMAIKYDLRRGGYGSTLLQFIHNEISQANIKHNVKYCSIGMCSTLQAKNFYVKNGEKCICKAVISPNLTCYWTLWNPDETQLNYWCEKLKQNGLKEKYVASRNIIIWYLLSIIPYRFLAISAILVIIAHQIYQYL